MESFVRRLISYGFTLNFHHLCIFAAKWNSSGSWWRCLSFQEDIAQCSPICCHDVHEPGMINENLNRSLTQAVWLQGKRNSGLEYTNRLQTETTLTYKNSYTNHRQNTKFIAHEKFINNYTYSCHTLMIIASSVWENGDLFTSGFSWLNHLQNIPHRRVCRTSKHQVYRINQMIDSMAPHSCAMLCTMVAHRKRQLLPERPQMPWASTDQFRGPCCLISCFKSSSSWSISHTNTRNF